jgi:YNFM family putative membrane transporter
MPCRCRFFLARRPGNRVAQPLDHYDGLTSVSLMFLAYLAGTWASSRAGAEAARFGRKRVLLVAVSIMMMGVAMTLSDNVIAVLIGLAVATAGFFGAHSTASGWTGQAPVGKAEASSLYNLFYYGGSSAIGWLGGVAFDARGWTAVAVMILIFAGIAASLAALFLHDT